MLSSLLKVACLTFISGFSPIKTDSSLFSGDLSVSENSFTETRNAVVGDSLVVYKEYFDDEYFSDFFYDGVSSASGALGTFYGYVGSDTYQFVATDFYYIDSSSDHGVIFTNFNDSVLGIDFKNKLLGYGSSTINPSISLDSIVIPYSSVLSDFYNRLESYVNFASSKKVIFKPDIVNYHYFQNIGNWVNTILNEYNYINVYCYFSPISNSVIQLSDGHSFQFVNENNLYFLDLNNDINNYNFGLFRYSEGYESYYFNDNFTIYFFNDDLYYSFLNAYELDVKYYQGKYFNSVFTFDLHFNYNAPYNTDLNSPLISDSFFNADPNDGQPINIEKSITWDLPLFISNGVYYRQIRVYYKSAIYRYFKFDEDTDPLICYKTNFGYFDRMVYVRASSGVEDIVCNRSKDTFYWTSSAQNNISEYYLQDCLWVNNNYRYLKFGVELKPQDLNFLSQFNVSSMNNLLGVDDPWVVQSFNLINVGFMGLISLLDIELLRGVSLGALVLIPFAVSLLFLAISFFKR